MTTEQSNQLQALYDNLMEKESNGTGLPFYPSNYSWSWDNSSNTSRCNITYTYLVDCKITSASSDFASTIGTHLSGSTFTISKSSNYGAASSSKTSEISGGNTIVWEPVEIS